MHRSYDTVVLTLAAILWASPGSAFEYTCPSDPGFCYFDVANDGCFDSGTDVGPIDALLEAGDFPTPLPPGDALPTDPGSIICPPKVKQLDIAAADWRTALGSDILLFGTKVKCLGPGGTAGCLDSVELRSGRDLFFGGTLFFNSGDLAPLASLLRFEANRDVVLVGGVRGSGHVRTQHFSFVVISTTGDIELAARGKYKTSRVSINSVTGSVDVGDRVRFDVLDMNQTSAIMAAGPITMSNPTIKTDRGGLFVSGSSLDIAGRATFGQVPKPLVPPINFSLNGTSGDVTIGSLSLTGSKVRDLVIDGESISIGTTGISRAKGTHPSSEIRLVADDEITVASADLTADEFVFETAGALVSITNSKLRGVDVGSTSTLQTGGGSTCVLTGTQFLGTALTENCGTIVGP